MRAFPGGSTVVARLDPRRPPEGADPGDEAAVGDSPPSSRLDAVALGLEGGLLATLSMTAFRMPIAKSLPPTAPFLARYLGGDPDDHAIPALALHLLYGAVLGGAFGLLFDGRFRGPEVTREKRGFVLGILYGLAASAFGTSVVLERLLGMDLEPDERWIFHASHAVYGLTLGTWYGSNA